MVEAHQITNVSSYFPYGSRLLLVQVLVATSKGVLSTRDEIINDHKFNVDVEMVQTLLYLRD